MEQLLTEVVPSQDVLRWRIGDTVTTKDDIWDDVWDVFMAKRMRMTKLFDDNILKQS